MFVYRTQAEKSIPSETLDARAPAQTEEEYQRAVHAVLATYRETHDAAQAHDTLLYFSRIPGDMKDVHLALVGAFGKLAAGAREDGERRLDALVAEYSWLSL